MSLEPYLRGAHWWAKGRVTYQGKPITPYYQCSTGAPDEQAAWTWCSDEEKRQIRAHITGPVKEEDVLTFSGAVMLYETNSKTANYLIPIVKEIGEMKLKDLNPKYIRGLGPKLYPLGSTVTWVRQVITPIRTVINNAHDLGKAAPISIKGYGGQAKIDQDKLRGSTGRKKNDPGSWEWVLKFRAHAERRVAALALMMFTTGARISQAIAMTPDHLNLAENEITIPEAKGFEARVIRIPDWLVKELADLPDLWPRGYERLPENRRVFGYADRSSPRKEWNKACIAAKIDLLPFHAAGRHGFGQEMNIRNPVDEKAAGAFGGWKDVSLMKRTYTHAENTMSKVHKAQSAGLKAAEKKTKTKLRKS